ncbi:MAG: hypothetical protein EZS28_027310 [Streblomastix strix]|uniref:Uncharacterized protein n=1 Tax=Streblomastix strix TaxID=222440 RepID=A0A5J4V3T2_9EUKA|nr:MAG: hypothetical protein EZS28_027310 [Streblomastix strix]
MTEDRELVNILEGFILIKSNIDELEDDCDDEDEEEAFNDRDPYIEDASEDANYVYSQYYLINLLIEKLDIDYIEDKDGIDDEGRDNVDDDVYDPCFNDAINNEDNYEYISE